MNENMETRQFAVRLYSERLPAITRFLTGYTAVREFAAANGASRCDANYWDGRHSGWSLMASTPGGWECIGFASRCISAGQARWCGY